MDFQVSVPGPFTYLVHEHARSIIAIQELQREVTSLLEFRDNVLQALPHLHSRGYHSLTPTSNDPSSSPAQAAPHHHAAAARGDVHPPGKAEAALHHMTSDGGQSQQQPPPHTHAITSAGAAGGTSTHTTTVVSSSNSSSSSSSSTGGGKSLSETHSSAVADSGFSTDKAGGSMGKSSSSSAGDHLSGVGGVEDHHWTSVEPELPLGSAEDELWQLLDVIQRKGTRLRNELERAERVERERVSQPPHQPTSSASDPPLASPRPHPAYRDLWPHSLPGPLGAYPSRGEFLPPPPPVATPVGLGVEAEAWAAVERLRQDRQYLVGRVSWAEAEAAASHQRLLDLHDQLMALAGDKRRLEEQVRALRLDPRFDPRLDPRIDPRVDPRVEMRNDLNLQFVKTNGVRRDGPASTGGIVHSVMGGVNTVHIVSDNTTSTTTSSSTSTLSSKSRRYPPSVTVSVAGEVPDDAQAAMGGGGRGGRMYRSASSVRINSERDVVLPRVLKVPIKDRSQRHSTGREAGRDASTSSHREGSTSKDQLQPSTSKDATSTKDVTTPAAVAVPPSTEVRKGSDRVVIERERRAGRADGGLSMPVSLLKGVKIKVQPNKQRISAILREKDVLELQRQLLTTVMETEVLKKQIETASEEWVSKTAEWESEQRQNHATITSLRQENLGLKTQLEERERTAPGQKDASVGAHPLLHTVATMTDSGDAESVEAATHTVHPGPNIKYDVVVHQEDTRHAETNNNTVGSSTLESGGRKAPPAVEKPPRRSREVRTSSSVGSWSSHHTTHSVSSHREASGTEVSGGRESVGRGAGPRTRPGLASGRSTPTATPRSSPAPSINTRTATNRNTLQEGARASPLGRSTSSVAASGRVAVGRRDSLKAPQGNTNGNGKSSNGAGGQHKNSSVFLGDKSCVNKPGSIRVGDGEGSSPTTVSSSLDSCGPPLALSDLKSPSPGSSPVVSAPQKKLFVLLEGQEESSHVGDEVRKAVRKKLSASDLYNKEDCASNDSVQNNLWVESGTGISNKDQNNETIMSELKLSTLKSGSGSTSPASSLASSGSFYDSINTDLDTGDDSTRLMHVEVAFDWNPLPTQEIRYLPPAAHMWTSTHNLNPDKRLPLVGNRTLNSNPVKWPSTIVAPASTKDSAAEGRRSKMTRKLQVGSISKTDSSESVDSHFSSQQGLADSLEEDDDPGFEAVGRMRSKLRAMNGAVRVKSIDRPSVLSMVQIDGVSPRDKVGSLAKESYSAVNSNSVASLSNLANNTQSSKKHDTSVKVSGNNSRKSHLQMRSPRTPASVWEHSATSTGQSSAELNARVHQILARIAASAQ